MVSAGRVLKAHLIPSAGRDTSTGLPRSLFHPCFGAFPGARLQWHIPGMTRVPWAPRSPPGAAPEPLDLSRCSIPAPSRGSRGHAQRPGRRGLTRPMEPCSHSVTRDQTTGPALPERCPWVLQGAGHPPPTRQLCGTSQVPPQGCDTMSPCPPRGLGGWGCSLAPCSRHWPDTGGAGVTAH